MRVYDRVGNYGYIDLDTKGISLEVNVRSPVEDTAAPGLSTLTFDPTVVDISEGDASVAVLANIADDLSGCTYGQLWFHSPSRNRSVYVYLRLDSGTRLDGIFEGTGLFPQYTEPGVWRPSTRYDYSVDPPREYSYMRVYDRVGNRDDIDLDAKGIPLTLGVISVPLEMRFTLEPTSAVNSVGTLHTLTATISQNSILLSDAIVTFEVIDGPHQGAIITTVTDANGKAHYSYTGASPGVDTIIASVDIEGDGEIDAARQATATWEQETMYTVTVNSTAGGTTDKDGSNTINDGESLTINATAAAGYMFIGWSGDASGLADPLTVTVASNMTITANFASIPPVTHTVTVNSTAGGSTDKDGTNVVNHGIAIQITPMPAAGYVFAGWSGDASGPADPLMVTVTSDMTIAANFERIATFQVVSMPVSDADITGTSAILRGKIYEDGGESNCWYRFRYFKKTDGFTQGVNTAQQTLTTVGGRGDFSQLLQGLEPSCTYVYQANAGNAKGNDLGRYMEFTTLERGGALLYVDAKAVGNPVQNGTKDHPYGQIQQAIDSAWDGDTVMVQPGTYLGTGNSRLDTLGKQITLRSLHGPESCIIDCQNHERAFHFHNGETAGTVLDGFTIIGGSGAPGSAVYCEGSSPTLANCIVRGSGPSTLWTSDQLHIRGTVTVHGGGLEGPGVIQVGLGQSLQIQSCTVRCDILGMGSWAVLSGEPSILAETALVDLGQTETGKDAPGGLVTLEDAHLMTLGDDLNGQASLHGRLRIQDQAVLQNTILQVRNNGSLEVVDQGSLVACELHAATDEYLILDAGAYLGSLADSEMVVILDQDQDFEIRGIPLCTEGDNQECLPGAHVLHPVPPLDAQTQTIAYLALAPGVKVNLVDQDRDQVGAPFDVIYVKDLVLAEGAELNLAGQRLYYETLSGQAHQIVDHTLYTNRLVEVNLGDPNAFNNDVTTNNTLLQIFVDLVDDANVAPEPVVRLQNQADQSARAKMRLGRFSEDEVVVSFSYLFSSDLPGLVLEVYLSDQQGLLPLDDPHMLLAGRIVPPILGCPGSFGSGLFASYALPVDVTSLDSNQGLWLELILSGPGAATQGFATMAVIMPDGDPSQGGAYVYDPALSSRCVDICMDLTRDGIVTPEDYTLVSAGCGRSVNMSTPQTSPLACMDRGYTQDGYVDASDLVNWGDLIGRCGLTDSMNLCSSSMVWKDTGSHIGTAFMSYSVTVPMAAPQAAIYSDLLFLGKGSAFIGGQEFIGHEDMLQGFDSAGASSQAYTLSSTQGQMRLIQGEQDVYILDSVKGLCGLDGEQLVGPGQHTFQGKTVTLGIQIDADQTSRGCPLRDVSFHNGDAYVAPVIVQESDGVTYQAGARLEWVGSDYEIRQLYYDPHLASTSDQSPNLRGLREIEVDSSGQVYLLNAYNQNGSNLLWAFSNAGRLLNRHFLDRLSESIKNPVGLCLDTHSGRLYVASGVFDKALPNQSVLCGYDCLAVLLEDALEPAQQIEINNLQHVTGISSDHKGTLWVAGFTLNKTPEHLFAYDLPFALPGPRLAQVDTSTSGISQIDAISLYGTMSINLPTSVLWLAQPQGE